MQLSDLTKSLVSRTLRLTAQPEVTPGCESYTCFNSGSTEIEVGEFLYGLVRLIKPKRVLETGTHYGVSAAYMAQALADNRANDAVSDVIVTLEVIDSYRQEAERLWMDIGLQHYIDCQLTPSMAFEASGQYDLLFLDSEPQYRFDEFVRFWPYVRPGGFILIHDLHPHLGHTGVSHHGMLDWPYGDFREKLGPYIKAHDVQTISFPSPRGFTLFQKVGDNFGANLLLKGESK